MKMQEAFEKALRGVVGQGEFARSAGGTCMYTRFVEGKELHCSVGHVLDPQQCEIIGQVSMGVVGVLERLERRDRPLVIEDLPASARVMPIVSQLSNFLTDMQRAHDKASEQTYDALNYSSSRDAHAMVDFIERMAIVAMRWKLVIPIDIMQLYEKMVAHVNLGRN